MYSVSQCMAGMFILTFSKKAERVVSWLFTSPCTNGSGVQFSLQVVCANGFPIHIRSRVFITSKIPLHPGVLGSCVLKNGCYNLSADRIVAPYGLHAYMKRHDCVKFVQRSQAREPCRQLLYSDINMCSKISLLTSHMFWLIFTLKCIDV